MFTGPGCHAFLKYYQRINSLECLHSVLKNTDGQGVFLVFPLTLLWEFTYSDFFGENALYPQTAFRCSRGRDVDGEMFDIVWWYGQNLVVFSFFFYFCSYLGKCSNFTDIFEMGWNHWPENVFGSEIRILAQLWGCHSYDSSTEKFATKHYHHTFRICTLR